MPFGPHILSSLEDALSEAFSYHDGLDNFVRRCGVPSKRLEAARASAEERAKGSARSFSRAPKRFVAQELTKALCSGEAEDDRLVARLIDGFCRGNFPEATATAKGAIAALISRRADEAKEAAARRDEHRARVREEEQNRERATAERALTRERFKEAFLQLWQQTNPQARGYMLEKFLNEYLAFEGLNPRGSFKLVGEQIDGSFSWASRTYLVEAKWVSNPVSGSGFSGLMYKIEGKTADTRGLLIAINGYSPEAIEGLKRKGELRFVCIDGAHLMRTLEIGGSFLRLLETIWRHASETGEAYVPVGSSLFQSA